MLPRPKDRKFSMLAISSPKGGICFSPGRKTGVNANQITLSPFRGGTSLVVSPQTRLNVSDRPESPALPRWAGIGSGRREIAIN